MKAQPVLECVLVNDRERLIRAALRELEPDEERWRHFGVLVIPPEACTDTAVREYLKRSPRPFSAPIEALRYTVRYIQGDKVVFVDLRHLDAMRAAVDAVFPEAAVPSRPKGFFRS